MEQNIALLGDLCFFALLLVFFAPLLVFFTSKIAPLLVGNSKIESLHIILLVKNTNRGEKVGEEHQQGRNVRMWRHFAEKNVLTRDIAEKKNVNIL